MEYFVDSKNGIAPKKHEYHLFQVIQFYSKAYPIIVKIKQIHKFFIVKLKKNIQIEIVMLMTEYDKNRILVTLY